MKPSQTFDTPDSHDGFWCNLTGTPKLSDSIDNSFMEVRHPLLARFWIDGQRKTWVSFVIVVSWPWILPSIETAPSITFLFIVILQWTIVVSNSHLDGFFSFTTSFQKTHPTPFCWSSPKGAPCPLSVVFFFWLSTSLPFQPPPKTSSLT